MKLATAYYALGALSAITAIIVTAQGDALRGAVLGLALPLWHIAATLERPQTIVVQSERNEASRG